MRSSGLCCAACAARQDATLRTSRDVLSVVTIICVTAQLHLGKSDPVSRIPVCKDAKGQIGSTPLQKARCSNGQSPKARGARSTCQVRRAQHGSRVPSSQTFKSRSQAWSSIPLLSDSVTALCKRKPCQATGVQHQQWHGLLVGNATPQQSFPMLMRVQQHVPRRQRLEEDQAPRC